MPDENVHGTTIESETGNGPLVCICGFTGTDDEVLDHLMSTTMDDE